MADVDEAKVMAELTEFSSKKGFFGLEFLWVANETVEPEAWWSGLCKHTELSKIATRVLGLPNTTAACERSFSIHANTHSKNRNRLTNEHAAKLVFVNHNLKLLEPIKPPHSEHSNSTSTGRFEKSRPHSLPSASVQESQPVAAQEDPHTSPTQSSTPRSSLALQNLDLVNVDDSSDSETECISLTSSKIPYDDETDLSLNEDLDDEDDFLDVSEPNVHDIADLLARSQGSAKQ